MAAKPGNDALHCHPDIRMTNRDITVCQTPPLLPYQGESKSGRIVKPHAPRVIAERPSHRPHIQSERLSSSAEFGVLTG